MTATPNAGELGRVIARICRDRRLMLSVAGDWRLAAHLRAGLHLRGGRGPRGSPRLRAATASAHDERDLCRARHAAVAFLSPVFPTASHPSAPGLGVVRWARLTRRFGNGAALGGIDGVTVRRFGGGLPRSIGAIGALS